jgi:hypothetical protein
MNFIVEPEGRKHWIVKCIDGGKLVEMHRFFRSHENFIHHRGKHAPHELDAERALVDFFQKTPGLALGPREYRLMPKS